MNKTLSAITFLINALTLYSVLTKPDVEKKLLPQYILPCAANHLEK